MRLDDPRAGVNCERGAEAARSLTSGEQGTRPNSPPTLDGGDLGADPSIPPSDGGINPAPPALIEASRGRRSQWTGRGYRQSALRTAGPSFQRRRGSGTKGKREGGDPAGKPSGRRHPRVAEANALSRRWPVETPHTVEAGGARRQNRPLPT